MLKVEHPKDYLKGANLEVTDPVKEEQNAEQSTKSFHPKLRVRRQYNHNDNNLRLLSLINLYKNYPALINDIKGLLNDVDINYVDKDGDTFLHAAVQEGHQDIVELLLNVPDIDPKIKNNQGDTPLDIAVSSGNQIIIGELQKYSELGSSNQQVSSVEQQPRSDDTLKELQKFSNDPQPGSSFQVNREGQNTDYDKVNERLEEFVRYFVKEFEAKLNAYHMILEGEVKKAGKFSDKFSEGVGVAVGAGIGMLLGSFAGPAALRAGATGGSALGKKGIGALGGELGKACHRKKVINLSELVYFSQKNQATVRKTLVEAGFDIFQSFEMQFMRVTTDQGHEGAMRKLAEDAVNRAISYLGEKKDAFITEAVIFGQSKIESVVGVPIPTSQIKTSGFEIKYEYKSSTEKWYTASLYEKAGLVREGKTPKDNSNYYEREDGKSRAKKYGYRRLFISEKWDELKYKSSSIVKGKNGQFTDYQYVLSSKDLEQKSNNIFKRINLDDKPLMEERVKKMLKEVKDDIIKEINILKKRIRVNKEDRKILANIEGNLKILKVDEYLEKFKNELMVHHQEDSQRREEIARDNKDEHKKTHQGINNLQKGQEVIIDEIRSLGRKDQDKKPIWFDVEDLVRPFTALTPGRQEKLEEIVS